MIIFGIALVVLATIGVFTISLCKAAKWADERMEEFDND